MATIRNEIRRLRFEHGEMTQQELADKINVTRQTVNAIELGKYFPSLEAAFRIAAVFGKPLESVFHFIHGPMKRQALRHRFLGPSIA